MTDNLKGGFIPFVVVRYRVFLLIVVDTKEYFGFSLNIT